MNYKLVTGLLTMICFSVAFLMQIYDNPDWEFFAFLSIFNYVGYLNDKS